MYYEEESMKVLYNGMTFIVPNNVYLPSEDTFLLARNIHVHSEDVVLDLGTGCGLLAVLAAKKATKVFAIDINPFAVRSVLMNAKLNAVHNRLIAICGDLFKPFRENLKFDLILFNAPYLPTKSFRIRKKAPTRHEWLEAAWSGGHRGREVLNEFIEEVPRRLTKRGRLLLVQSTITGVDETLRKFEEKGIYAEVIDEEPSFFEKIVLIKGRVVI